MCEYCHLDQCCPNCPNYIPPKAEYYCSICGDGIYSGEDYVINNDDKYAHYHCLCDIGLSETIYWLGNEIKIMENSIN